MTIAHTASIVLYHNDSAVLSAAIHSALGTPGLQTLYLIDNSGTDRLRTLATDRRIVYEHPGRNLGFGAGHNCAVHKTTAPFHAIVNPDVKFGPSVIPALIEILRTHPKAGAAGPALSEDGHHRVHSCRARPTPIDLIGRRFFRGPLRRLLREREARFVRQDLPIDRPSEVEALSGAFMVCSVPMLRQLGGFDSRYFMYLEDYDLCRAAIAAGYRCIYEPRQVVLHRYGAHSYNRLRPLLWHVRSAIRYFNKWGWRPLH